MELISASRSNPLMDQIVSSWMTAMTLKDPDTAAHSRRVANLALELAVALQIPEEHLPLIQRAALLHDLGKIVIPDAILRKPGPLTAEEMEIGRQHAAFGAQILQTVDGLVPLANLVLHHHENWDGSGYPFGLQGEDIPYNARILSVVESWDALLSDQPYRPAYPISHVIQILLEQQGKQFDPHMVEIFLEMIR